MENIRTRVYKITYITPKVEERNNTTIDASIQGYIDLVSSDAEDAIENFKNTVHYVKNATIIISVKAIAVLNEAFTF